MYSAKCLDYFEKPASNVVCISSLFVYVKFDKAKRDAQIFLTCNDKGLRIKRLTYNKQCANAINLTVEYGFCANSTSSAGISIFFHFTSFHIK